MVINFLFNYIDMPASLTSCVSHPSFFLLSCFCCLRGEAWCQGVSSPFLEWVFQIWKLRSRGVLGSGPFAQAELVVFAVWWIWSALHTWDPGGCKFHVDGKFEKYAIVFVQANRLCCLIDAPRHRQSTLRGRVDWEVEGLCWFSISCVRSLNSVWFTVWIFECKFFYISYFFYLRHCTFQSIVFFIDIQ